MYLLPVTTTQRYSESEAISLPIEDRLTHSALTSCLATRARLAVATGTSIDDPYGTWDREYHEQEY